MALFHPRVIEKHSKHVTVPAEHLSILKQWAESLAEGTFERETSHDGEFIQRILVDVLGYVGSSGGVKWTVAKNQPVGSGNVDVAIGRFTANTTEIIAPFELKGARTRNLDAIMAGRNKSPVQQAWEYAMDAKGAKWVLVSNYREIRLYAVGYGRKDYEQFDLNRLSDPKNYARFMLLLSAENLLGDHTFRLLKESENKSKEITDSLYKDYKDLRGRMIRTLQKDNPKVPVLDVIQYTQTILDRILFVAFAGDRGLLPENALKSCYEDKNKWNPQPAWENFKGLFHSIDKGNPPLNIPGYNGGLFAKNASLDNLAVSEEICEGFKTIGGYDFESEVSVNILGHIFEQSISDIEEIKATSLGNETLLDKKKSKRKKDGIFYTPPYITRYIVDQAVGGWLNKKKKQLGLYDLPEITDEEFALHAVDTSRKGFTKKITKEFTSARQKIAAKIKKHIQFWAKYQEVLKEIKVLDPACGSGAFLNEVFDYLAREGRQINEQLLQLTLNQHSVFRWDTHILANNIFGVDLNSESVEITKLSLWLKTANRGEKLTYLDGNIKCGNSLIDDAKIGGASAFEWSKEFNDIMESGGFDVIVGNPPYIPIEMLEEEDKNFFRKRFDVLERKFDSSVIFIMHGLNLLNDNGLLGYISSVTWQTGENYAKLRERLINHNGIRKIVNLPFDIFEDAYVETCAYILSKKKRKVYRMYCFDKHDTNVDLENIDYQKIEMDAIQKPDYKIILNAASNDIFDRIKNATDVVPLGSITHSTQGLSKSRYELVEKRGHHQMPFWAEGSINRYRMFPELIQYVSMEDKESLKGFYAEGDKLLIRRIISRQDRLMVTYTNKEMVFTKDVNPFLVTDKAYNPKYLLALVASKLISYLYINSSSIATKDDFRQTTLAEVRAIPIKFATPSIQKKFAEHADTILDQSQALHECAEKFIRLLRHDLKLDKVGMKLEQWYNLDFSSFVEELAKKKVNLVLGRKAEWMEVFEKNLSIAAKMKSAIQAAEDSIDEMVYELYGLTKSEIANIENSMPN